MRRIALIVALVSISLALPGRAGAARVAVGLAHGAKADVVAAAVERRTGTHAHSLKPIPALVVDVPAGVSLQGISGVRYVEPVLTRHLAFTPSDPLVPKQWYLSYSGFYSPWITLPAFEPIPVAVIDSGVDAGHPDLAGRILDAKSFVGGSARVDTLGHGTFVAGLIGAGHDNGIGIAGLAPSSELLIAKVVTKSRAIPVDAEARAIRWAVDNGARVINMSLGGIRDPLDPDRDTYSRLEADAVAYAVSNGVVVVAAVGNSDQAPTSPWKYASYPAALPHVLGVSAMNDTGGIPSFSNRDPIYNDLAAPGLEILSILPRPLTARFPSCSDQGYSSCGPDEFREAQGTSFAAPQVSAAAAVLLSLRPTLRPEQVTKILQSTAIDLDPETGCDACADGRDSYSGWGRLDVAAAVGALSKPIPRRDFYESNDDLGARAYHVYGQNRRLQARVDFWDDQDDVYAIRLNREPTGLRRADRGRRERRSEPRVLASPGALGRTCRGLSVSRAHVCPHRLAPVPLVPPTARRDVLRAGAHVESGRHALPARDHQGLEQFVLRHVAQHSRRVADDDHARRHVLRHHRSGADERLLADLDPGTEDRSTAHASAAANGRPLHQLMTPLRSTHEVVVRRDDARRDEDVVLERRVGRDVRLRLDLGQRPDRRVVLDEGTAAEHDVVADRHTLAHAGLVTENHPRADPRAGEDDGSRGDDRSVPDLGRRQRLALGRRARRQGWLLADDGVLEHLHTLPEHRSRVDGGARVDLSRH